MTMSSRDLSLAASAQKKLREGEPLSEEEKRVVKDYNIPPPIVAEHFPLGASFIPEFPSLEMFPPFRRRKDAGLWYR